MEGRPARWIAWGVAPPVSLVVMSLAIGAPPAEAGCGGVKKVGPRAKQRLPGRPPLVIGDSVLLGAVDEAARAGYEVDVRGCRQMGEGLRVLRARRRAGRLPRFAVIALGTNLSISQAQVRQALRIIGPRRILGLVTPRETGGRSGSDARVVRAAGRRHPRRTVVLDWVAYSAGHAGWFAADGIHLGPGGAAGFARLLRRALRAAAPVRSRLRPSRAQRRLGLLRPLRGR